MGLERQKGVWHSWGTETVESQIVLHKLSMNIKLDCVGAIGEGSGVEREKWEEREKKEQSVKGRRSRDIWEEGCLIELSRTVMCNVLDLFFSVCNVL